MMGWVCSASFGRKRDMSVRRLRRCTSLTLLGLHISMMALHFLGLAFMPRCVSMKPRNLPRSMPKTHFPGLRQRLYYRNTENTTDRGFDNHVVDVYFDTFAHYMVGDFIHQPLVSCSYVFEIERHNFIKVVDVICDEGGLVHISYGHWDLNVSGICI